MFRLIFYQVHLLTRSRWPNQCLEEGKNWFIIWSWVNKNRQETTRLVQ